MRFVRILLSSFVRTGQRSLGCFRGRVVFLVHRISARHISFEPVLYAESDMRQENGLSGSFSNEQQRTPGVASRVIRAGRAGARVRTLDA